MSRKSNVIVAVAAAVVAAGTVAGVAGAAGPDAAPPDGAARTQAERAALAHTGGGTVLEVEVDDGGPGYEVEVRRPDGSVVEVHLDESYQVTGSGSDDTDGPGQDDDDGAER